VQECNKVQNSIIENDRFSTEKKAAIIRVVAPLQSGSQKEVQKMPISEIKTSRRVVW